jgi:hypothetical protein
MSIIDLDEVQAALDKAAHAGIHGTDEDKNGRFKGPAQVINFPGHSKANVPAENVLAHAVESDLKEAIVIGRCQDGTNFYASSLGDAGHIILELEKFKKMLLEAYCE